MKELFWGSETKMGRAFVQERVLDNENSIDILDYEKASHIIKNAKHIGVSSCYCRHKAHHLGDDCYAPMETCLSFDTTAYTLNKHGYARKIDAKVLIRGIRNVNDFSYEFDLSLVNHNLNPEIETLFMPTETRYVIVKSSSIKELAQFGGDISGMVPPVVCEAVLKKYRK